MTFGGILVLYYYIWWTKFIGWTDWLRNFRMILWSESDSEFAKSGNKIYVIL